MTNLVAAAYDSSGQQVFDPNVVGRGNSYVFTGIWSRRPIPTAALAGAQMCITDVPIGGRSFWWCDGTYWKPVNGQVSIYNQNGGYTNVLASVTWAGAAILMALPGGSPKIPGGMIIPGQTELRYSALWYYKPGGVGGVNCNATLGTSNSFGDSQLAGQFVNTNNEWEAFASVTFPTTALAVQANPSTGRNGAPAGAVGAEYATNINTNADMFMNFGTNTGTTNGNILALVRLRIDLLFP